MSGAIRRHPRFQVMSKVLLQVPFWSSTGPRVEVRGRIRDASRGGMGLLAQLPPEDVALTGLRPGLPLEIRFRAGRSVLTLPAEVVWARSEGGSDSVIGVRLRLDLADAATRKEFEQWAARHEADAVPPADPAAPAPDRARVPPNERLECRLALLMDVLDGLMERLQGEELDPQDADRVDVLAELLQNACTTLELRRFKARGEREH